MDASASPKSDAVNVLSYYSKIDRTNFSQQQVPQRNTIIKYTKIPDFDFDTQVSWPTHTSYSLQPRLRRIIALDDDNFQTSRSLKSKLSPCPKSSEAYRKITSIPVNENVPKHQARDTIIKSSKSIKFDVNSEKVHHTASNKVTTKLSSSTKSKEKIYSPNLISRAVSTNFKPRQPLDTPHSPISTKETKTSAKTNSAYNRKEPNVFQTNNRLNNATSKLTDNYKSRQLREKDLLRNPKGGTPQRTSLSKNFNISNNNEKGISQIKNVFYENLKKEISYRSKSTDKTPPNRKPIPQNRNKISFKDFVVKNAVPIMVRVPLDKNLNINSTQVSKSSLDSNEPETRLFRNNFSYTDDIILLKHVNVSTDPNNSIDQVTEMDDLKIEDYKRDNSVQTERMKEIFDSLEIPNVTLTKDKSEIIHESVKSCSSSLPNLKLSSFNKTSSNQDANPGEISMHASASYVYSSATLTYTTRKKINFQVVDGDEIRSNLSPSPLRYPLNVVSVFKRELEKKIGKVTTDDKTTTLKNKDSCEDYLNRLNDLNTLDCSYVFNKVMKPADIISTIRVHNGLLQNDYVCEQFQRELNFIDSFFASLQYLENCSLAEKSFSDTKVDCLIKNSVLFDSDFDVKNSEYDNFLSKLENGANIEDSETMASKSLCLLNLLIRDEQRRAKNLLFVLKMREDALKDFTKSQILWLENKKKHDNTDISTLKKKQRGALLKLQHECGEMQRMRKALITLSEKRKVALMKTKKNIELKLNNNVDVEHIILGKKKLKRTASVDRNTSPLKCFDLSSSGCEESTSRPNSELTFVQPTALPGVPVASEQKCGPIDCAEKYIQTGDAPLSLITPKEQDTDVTTENLVAVDGGYLNIIFNDLALPQIFSSGKQYEVNEKELKNIVTSKNNPANDNEVVEKVIEQVIMNKDLDSSTPSTARSLVDEFDQYYKGLTEIDKNISAQESEELDRDTSSVVQSQDESKSVKESPESQLFEYLFTTSSVEVQISDKSLMTSSCNSELMTSNTNQSVMSEEHSTHPSQITGPLPVPVGATAVVDSLPADVNAALSLTSLTSGDTMVTLYDTDNETITNNHPNCNSSLASSPVQFEAEELRRQQLAIEREIKALEQQQCRMLVVREIPDKPPPPYTPPNETKPKPPRMFVVDDTTELKILSLVKELCSPSNKDVTSPSSNSNISRKDEAYELFLTDFCKESVEYHKQEDSDKPWDACNLLPQKRRSDLSTVIRNTTANLADVLTNPSVGVVSVVSGRRSDHIDDILFNEWRRCEPEWTTLHNEEAIVKNQLFENIFQKVLTETVDEYKKIVQAAKD